MSCLLSFRAPHSLFRGGLSNGKVLNIQPLTKEDEDWHGSLRTLRDFRPGVAEQIDKRPDQGLENPA